jgi:two-component SAPR family response regulator
MKNINNLVDHDLELGAMEFQPLDKRILVVDDDQEIFTWFKLLQMPGSQYSFHYLNNELKILDALHLVDPDMVFLDVCLKSIPGRRVGEIIQQASYFNIPIVYMSSKKSWSIGKSISDPFFISKPLDKKIVNDKIRSILKIK